MKDGVLNFATMRHRHVAAGNGERTASSSSPTARRRDADDQLRRAPRRRHPFANTLKKMGVRRATRVTIYMPMIPRARRRLCLRAHRRGAQRRLRRFLARGDPRPDRGLRGDWVICADEGLRGGKTVPLKANVDKALERIDVKAVLVIAHTGGDIAMKEGATIGMMRCRPASRPIARASRWDRDPLFIL